VDAVARTNLEAGGVRLEMVEHLLSALAALEVDCCTVSLTADELPRLDGSSLAFVEAIDDAGVVSLEEPVAPLVACDRLRVGDDEAWIEVLPPRFPGLSVDYVLDYGPGPIGWQKFSIEITPDSYRRELAMARTFITIDEADRLRAAGLGLDVSMQDLVVFGPHGPVDNRLRWPDECVRHKVLDLVGDLALAGRPIHGHVRAYRSGHRLNAMLAAKLVRAAVEQAAGADIHDREWLPASQCVESAGDGFGLDPRDHAVSLPAGERLQGRGPAAVLLEEDRPRLVLAHVAMDAGQQATGVGVRRLDHDGDAAGGLRR
jgi:UDP-3-O-acyl N-acetylglucosamine deacetylase